MHKYALTGRSRHYSSNELIKAAPFTAHFASQVVHDMSQSFAIGAAHCDFLRAFCQTVVTPSLVPTSRYLALAGWLGLEASSRFQSSRWPCKLRSNVGLTDQLAMLQNHRGINCAHKRHRCTSPFPSPDPAAHHARLSNINDLNRHLAAVTRKCGEIDYLSTPGAFQPADHVCRSCTLAGCAGAWHAVWVVTPDLGIRYYD
ncbi:hypothetical protein CC86DRAFT_90467 [Ophiobolus disseminans]|uniref:Uncharacterized protein n=1 Tax=Ophiobolus disseminans TaxID=1469910 RepID=A0A6A7AH76_9PLEO|nr:hypothetical protein CC86DRAFT_90467 [Ophiobolus disseminans]